MFELELNLCERFSNLTPFLIRKERFYDVFSLVRKLNKHNQKESEKNEKVEEKRIKKVNGKTRVYVPVTS